MPLRPYAFAFALPSAARIVSLGLAMGIVLATPRMGAAATDKPKKSVPRPGAPKRDPNRTNGSVSSSR